MSEAATFAPEFKRWADGFSADVRLFVGLLGNTALPEDVRRTAAGALNYLLMQHDVVPDHLGVAGVLDDAFVLRVAATMILERDSKGLPTELARLANDDERVRAFLGPTSYDALVQLVRGLETRDVRGRTPAAVVGSDKERRHFTEEIQAQLDQFRPGPIEDAARLERDLLSYFRAKLGRV